VIKEFSVLNVHGKFEGYSDSHTSLLHIVCDYYHPIKGTGMYLSPFNAIGSKSINPRVLYKLYCLVMTIVDIENMIINANSSTYDMLNKSSNHLHIAFSQIPEDIVKYAIDNIGIIRW
jgi:hypothetical protein